MNKIDWNLYQNFSEKEFKCSHTGECNMFPELLDKLQLMRDRYRKPIFISSGFRSVEHPVEQEKDKPGEHTIGMAVDILCHGRVAVELLGFALDLGITRIGVHQKGNPNARFIHLGIADKYTLDFPSGMWTY